MFASARQHQHRGEIRANCHRLWLEPMCASGLLNCLGEMSLLYQHQTEPLSGQCIIWIELEYAPKLALGTAPIPIVMPFDERQRRARLGESFIALERIECRNSGLGHVLGRIDRS